ncbi:chromate efflux transporter [Altererythrobacter sp. KTW20L]|uniref:chromate efflux transporter n=1 Tax=Altererythrobacter sp. KTW20L TaxID=2942210 RepID=UPI0020BD6F59|nr:chromate efflux transporter [Altererythrobacter sp. KTW20L]MCL6250964.1 chromate efflux transporter [Altererythrobacter sp. KTW20L]
MTLPDNKLPAAPPQISLPALFLKFLRFGCLAFGGPIAQIAMVKQALVTEGRWIELERFNRLLAVMQILPGPEAHELCVHMGIIARGRIGGILAGLGFMLPGFILMLACGFAYSTLVAGRDTFDSVLLGVQVAVLAVIARAVQRIGGHVLTDRWLWALGFIAAAATLADVPFWLPLVAAAFAYAGSTRPGLRVLFAALAMVAAYALLPATAPAPTLPGGPAQDVTLLALFVAGLKGGLLTFGGAYTAIPYVREDTVGRGWLGDGEFLDGVAFANMLPAPLVIFATFAGYIAGGVPGALAITAGMFLPAFAFSLLLFERLEAVIENQRLHRTLDGVAAAVVGVIAATLLQLGAAAWARLPDPLLSAPVFVLALAAAFSLKGGWVAPAIIAAGGAAGWALFG